MASVDDLLAECADGDGWAAAAQSVHVAPAPVPTAAPALPFAHCSPPTAPTLLQFNLPRCCAAGRRLRDRSRVDERLGALHQPKACAGPAAYLASALGRRATRAKGSGCVRSAPTADEAVRGAD